MYRIRLLKRALFVRNHSQPRLPTVKNEVALDYAPGSVERAALRAALNKVKSEVSEIPCVVGGKEVWTGNIQTQVMPTNHGHTLCKWHMADADLLNKACEAALESKRQWENMSFKDRSSIFLKAADLLATKYRYSTLAALMLGQGKNVWQAEIDAACEVIDFWRFNCKFAEEIYSQQPTEHSFGVWNAMEYRALEGFVLAVTPFNFLAIGSNLHSTPALMGNCCVWKPASTAILASYEIYKILTEAGMPPGVLNFVPSKGSDVSRAVLPHKHLAGVHFTGSTDTFAVVWQQISYHLRPYHQYPRVVGETGGKNFHFIHESADIPSAVNHTVRAAFEYQGQKCSAASRLYVPSNKWPEIKELLLSKISSIKMSCVEDFESFMCAVIDKSAFDSITDYIKIGKSDPNYKLLAGGTYDDSRGYFIAPTVFQTDDPNCKLMEEEIFGPVLTVYVYPHDKYEETLKLCDQTSKYALTGAIFAQDRWAIVKAAEILKYASGNFYINDKSTGAVVGQQPFGGGRGSGTNDKAGCFLNLLRWISLRTVKESFVPLNDFRYPSNQPGH